ncbi:Transposase, Mutator family [Lentibacillus halodurans]|uniref:Transposase, Mutator family n=1 Tax=Lentibacillus halodurans TaxID=237679 RepID=A0A1I0ZSP2_9BACI|nr:Transposase, Mutator family [Lentibacillus halodurans]
MFGQETFITRALYYYSNAIRKVMYRTNAVESIHTSFRKVTKTRAFPNENALLEVLYLRIKEQYKMGRWPYPKLGNGYKPTPSP